MRRTFERVLELSNHDAAFLLKLLEGSARPNAKLSEALQRYENKTLDAGKGVFDWKPRRAAT
jgi:hypothetical protein